MRSRAKSGFGIVELLIALLVVSALAVLATRSLRKEIVDPRSAFKGTDIRGLLRGEIEGYADTGITEAGLNSFSFRNEGGSGTVMLSGDPPFASLEKEFTDKTGDSHHRVIITNLSSLRFTYYDEQGRLLIDDVAFSSPDKISRVKVVIRVHNGKEERGYFMDDGIRGVDLDGDKSNGSAKLSERSFLIDLK